MTSLKEIDLKFDRTGLIIVQSSDLHSLTAQLTFTLSTSTTWQWSRKSTLIKMHKRMLSSQKKFTLKLAQRRRLTFVTMNLTQCLLTLTTWIQTRWSISKTTLNLKLRTTCMARSQYKSTMKLMRKNLKFMVRMRLEAILLIMQMNQSSMVLSNLEINQLTWMKLQCFMGLFQFHRS